jgi:hypothetical protein
MRPGASPCAAKGVPVGAALAACLVSLALRQAAAQAPPLNPAAEALLRSFAQRVAPVFAGQAAAPPPARSVQIAEGEDLIFTMRLGSLELSDSLTAKKIASGTAVSLAEFANALDFPIDVDPAKGRAEGWFIREQRRFSLDLGRHEVTVAGVARAVPDSLARRDGDDILVDTKLLAQWFGLFIDVDYADLTLRVTSATPLPVQERLARQQARPLTAPAAEPVLPRQDIPYKAADWPTVEADVAEGVIKSRSSGVVDNTAYSVLAAGDLGYLSGTAFVSGERADGSAVPVDTARVTLRREDPDGRLPLGATDAEIGEVQVATLPIVGAGTTGFERGARLTNQPLGQLGRFSSTQLTGDAQPGWDVDLYRNGALIGTQHVGSDGRYQFQNVDLFLGENSFRLVFIGPQGQQREETRSVPLGLGLAGSGKTLYDITVSQKDTPFYVFDLAPTPNQGSARIAAEAAYGLTEGLALNFGGTSTDYLGGRRNILHTGLTGEAGGILGAIDAVGSDRGGYGYEALAQTALGGQNLRASFEHIEQLPFGVDEQITTETLVGIGLLGSIEPGFLEPLSYGVSASKTFARPTGDDVSATFTLSTVVGRTTLLNSVDWTQTPSPAATPDTTTPSNAAKIQDLTAIENLSTTSNLTTTPNSPPATGTLGGTLQAIFPVGDVLVRSLLAYQASPHPQVNQANITLGYAFTPEISSQFGVSGNFQGQGTEGFATVDWDFGRFRLGPRLSYSDNGTVTALLEASLSIEREPVTGQFVTSSGRLAETGSVSAHVYADADGTQPLAGVKVSALQDHVTAVTDASGVALLTGLQPNVPTDVAVDPSSVPDLFQRPATAGVSVVPRRGVVAALAMPVVETGDVEGVVTGEDGKTPLRAIRLRLQRAEDGGLVATQLSAFDGVYVFPDVPVGHYRVVPDPADLARRGFAPVSPAMAEVPAAGGPVEVPVLRLGGGQAYALRFGRYASELGRLGAWLLLRVRQPELVAGLTLDEAPLPGQDHDLLVGRWRDRDEAARSCARFAAAALGCEIVGLGAGG